jgi:polyferredoxin
VYKGLAWSLIILIPTLFLGRFFCNWVCPYGIIHHFIGWLFGSRNSQQKIESNRYRPLFAFKYYVLLGMLIAALFGSLQIGLLDPIVFVYRAFTVAVLPAANMPLQEIAGDYKSHAYAWVIGFLFLFFVGMNIIIPRFFCRVVCPLGALLGVFSRFAFWRIERDPVKCTDCDMCLISCEGASDPHTQLRMSECFVCFNCIEDCPHEALSFAFLPEKQHEVKDPDIRRRHAIFAALTGGLFFGWTQSSGKSTHDFSAAAIRPPGSVEELEFLERCIKCDQCIRVCPTNVLQPAALETGLEGLWTPVMNFRMGACQYQCTACGHVCPTGAIQRITVEEKLGLGHYSDVGPIKLGTAHFDHGRCLPWSKNIPCVVCEEVCPTAPKAIHTEYRMVLIREGKKSIRSATPDALTVTDYPAPGEAVGEPCTFRPGMFKSDVTTSYHVKVRGRDGVLRTYPIISNDADTLQIDGTFDPMPEPGDVAAIHLQLKVPKIDTALCIGCGLCELECPVVGDRRAVYVTAEGETRSGQEQDRSRNRSLRLTRVARAGDTNSLDVALPVLAQHTPTKEASCCGRPNGCTSDKLTASRGNDWADTGKAPNLFDLLS